MSDPFIAEIRIFAGNFAPRSWAWCNGQLLQISQNTALFSLLGTIYGGDGRTTFGLPNLKGRPPMHWGNGPGLTERRIGETGGAYTHALTVNQMPSHNHQWRATDEDASEADPTGRYVAVMRDDSFGESAAGTMHSNTIAPAGGGQSHKNIQPYLAMYFIIALQGIYPSRN